LAVVRLQAKRSRGQYVTFMITLPKDYVDILGWQAGEKLVVELAEKEGKRGVFIYRV
jgi:hypothetical protein